MGDEVRRHPARRSWVDVLIAWVERLPGPPWVYYLGATLVITVVGTALTWLEGSEDVGALSFVRIFNDAAVLYQLALIHYLQVTARTALASFSPALGDLAPERERLERLFTTVRPVFAIAGLLAGLVWSLQFVLLDPAGVGLSAESSIATWIFVGVTGTFSSITTVILVLFVLSLMVLIVRVHRQATAITIFDARSHGAFARLTLRSSIGLALPVYVFTGYQLLAGNPNGAITVPELLTVVMLLGGAIAVFFVPLVGIHRRLVREKADLIAAANQRFAVAGRDLHTRVDSRALAGVEQLKTVLESLVIERDVVKKLSTWPWEADTIRGFVSSIALPILLWFVTTLLGRLLGT